ncbi:MAG: hypothetical protein RLZ12_168 [Bacillota bacterium]|jgi:predicted RNA-binding protein YlxR (DUF448 family)
MKPRELLLRIVRTPEGKVILDLTNGKTPGRGAYLVPSKKNIEIIKKKRLLERTLKLKEDVTLDFFMHLERYVDG